jgi:hypothetical protein
MLLAIEIDRKISNKLWNNLAAISFICSEALSIRQQNLKKLSTVWGWENYFCGKALPWECFITSR